jgi:peptidoglycan/xylan/chitin deacetylase (PgdA/CDA1 family)
VSRLLAAAAAALLAVAAPAAEAPKKAPRLKVALTFDDLPINGALPLGKKQSDFARDTIKVLKRHRIAPSYGFINASKLERNPDGALALRIWIEGGHPLANHTYSHIDLITTTVEEFQREILRNEPALQLLQPRKSTDASAWKWFRYPYLHEGETLEKRRAVRAFLAGNGYRIAQTTLDFEDYLWNSAHARCWLKKDEASIQWLRESYLTAAREFTRFQITNSRAVFGRDIHHVMLLHLGSFSSHILPDLFKVLDEEGLDIVTLEQAQKDAAYDYDPDVAARGGTLVELGLQAKNIGWPTSAPSKPRERLTTICQ